MDQRMSDVEERLKAKERFEQFQKDYDKLDAEGMI